MTSTQENPRPNELDLIDFISSLNIELIAKNTRVDIETVQREIDLIKKRIENAQEELSTHSWSSNRYCFLSSTPLPQHHTAREILAIRRYVLLKLYELTSQNFDPAKTTIWRDRVSCEVNGIIEATPIIGAKKLAGLTSDWLPVIVLSAMLPHPKHLLEDDPESRVYVAVELAYERIATPKD